MSAARPTSNGSSWVSAAFCAASLALRITVKIVPSVGFITALYAASTPSLNALARSFAPAEVKPLKPFEKPLKISESITPELPLAPLKRAEAHFAEASSTVQLSSSAAISLAAAVIVILILVPVSPSGTGKTLSASTACLLFEMLFAAEIIESLNNKPVIINN